MHLVVEGLVGRKLNKERIGRKGKISQVLTTAGPTGKLHGGVMLSVHCNS